MRIYYLFIAVFLSGCLLKKGKVSPLTKKSIEDEARASVEGNKSLCDLSSFKIEKLGEFSLSSYDNGTEKLIDYDVSGDLRAIKRNLSFSLKCKDPKVIQYLFEHYKKEVFPKKGEEKKEIAKNKSLYKSVSTVAKYYLLKGDSDRYVRLHVNKAQNLVQSKFIDADKDGENIFQIKVKRSYWNDLTVPVKGRIEGYIHTHGPLAIKKDSEEKFSFKYASSGRTNIEGNENLETTKKIIEELDVSYDKETEKLLFHVKKYDISEKVVGGFENEFQKGVRDVSEKVLYNNASIHMAHFYNMLKLKKPEDVVEDTTISKTRLESLMSFLKEHRGRRTIYIDKKEETGIEVLFKEDSAIEFKDKKSGETLECTYSIPKDGFNEIDESFMALLFHDPAKAKIAKHLGLEPGAMSHSRRIKFEKPLKKLSMEFLKKKKKGVREKIKKFWKKKIMNEKPKTNFFWADFSVLEKK